MKSIILLRLVFVSSFTLMVFGFCVFPKIDRMTYLILVFCTVLYIVYVFFQVTGYRYSCQICQVVQKYKRKPSAKMLSGKHKMSLERIGIKQKGNP